MQYDLKLRIMSLQYNLVGWFEIPVSDMERAIEFYKSVFQAELEQ